MKTRYWIAVMSLAGAMAAPAAAFGPPIKAQSADDAAWLYHHQAQYLTAAAKECKRLKSRMTPSLIELAKKIETDDPALYAAGKALRAKGYSSPMTEAATREAKEFLASYKTAPAQHADVRCASTAASVGNEAEQLRADARRFADDAGPFQASTDGSGYTEDQVLVNYYMMSLMAADTLEQCGGSKDPNLQRLRQAVEAYRAVNPRALEQGKKLLESGSTGVTADLVRQQLDADRKGFDAMNATQRKTYCSDAVQGVNELAARAKKKWR